MYREEGFVNYKTSTYKLHLYETQSGYKFIMLSDPNTDSLRFVLRQIYAGPFLEYVVRNPLFKVSSNAIHAGVQDRKAAGYNRRAVRPWSQGYLPSVRPFPQWPIVLLSVINVAL